MKGCNKDCICLTCQKSCMKACKNCSKVIEMHVRHCKEYTNEGKQVTVDEFLKELGKE